MIRERWWCWRCAWLYRYRSDVPCTQLYCGKGHPMRKVTDAELERFRQQQKEKADAAATAV